MALEDFASWRAEGGVIVSDSLGTRAVRRNYDASEQSFNGPLVARDAFLAGNDLLYLGNFISSGEFDNRSTIVNTVTFFAQKYREDSAFAERVNRAVARILKLKFELYPTFRPDMVYASATGQDQIGANQTLVFEIGLEAATLLSPTESELPNVLPETPRINERIVYIVDGYTASQCEVCAEEAVLLPEDFERAAERLYGPGAGNLIAPGNVTSFSFRELTVALDTMPGEDNVLLSNLSDAEWIVIGMLDVTPTRPNSLAFTRLLAERPGLIQGKKVVVFALGAPYYLDATDTTKISAYYGLYSKQRQMADIAARILFKEITPRGASPVSVAGTGYNLLEITSPDPERPLPLSVTRISTSSNGVENTPQTPEATITPEENGTIVYQAGDLLALSAGPILDHNGNPVPDDTPVTFSVNIATEGTPIQRQIVAATRSGSAQANYSIEGEGSLVIQASSGDPATVSNPQQFSVSGVNPEGIALQATQTAVAQLQANASSEGAGGDSSSTPPNGDMQLVADLVDWFLSVIVAMFVALIAYQTGSFTTNARWGVRWALGAFLGGLVGTSYLALGLPGSADILQEMGAWGVALMTIFCAGLGWGGAWFWRRSKRQKAKA
jgi:beta-N-acetylhexosaminidase